MTTVFDPKRHLTPTDEKRLEAEAKKRGITPGDFIESALKRELFASTVIATVCRKTRFGKEVLS